MLLCLQTEYKCVVHHAGQIILSDVRLKTGFDESQKTTIEWDVQT